MYNHIGKCAEKKLMSLFLIFSGAGQTNYFCEFMIEDLWCCKYARQPDFRDPNSISLANSRVSKKKKNSFPVAEEGPILIISGVKFLKKKIPLFTSEPYR